MYQRPALLTEEAEAALIRRLGEHVAQHDVDRFSILLHGGEPLLLGKKRTRRFLDSLRALEDDLDFTLTINLTTNGTLLDDEWATLLCEHEVGVTVSLDGPEAIHDRSRKDFRGNGTHERVVHGLQTMRRHGVDPGLLAVCDPSADPRALLRYFVDELHAGVDILVPDATHEDDPPSIAPFYCGLFDTWYDEYSERGVSVRFLSSLVKGLLGVPSRSESIGYGQITTMTMLTDGSLEALDILRTSRHEITRSALNIIDDPLIAINDDPIWQEVREASLTLADVCQACEYRLPCGGGHVASRWSEERRYDNPSVYCEDFKTILAHVWSRISPDLQVELEDHSRVPFLAVSR